MPNLAVGCSVLALRPTPTNPQQKSTGKLIEIRRHVSTASEYQSLLLLSSSSSLNNKSSLKSQSTNEDAAIGDANDGSDSDNNNHFYGFVLWSSGQDDRRLSTWMPISEIFFPDGSCIASHETFVNYFSAISSSSSPQSSSQSSMMSQGEDAAVTTNTSTLPSGISALNNSLINRKARAPIPFDQRQRLIAQGSRNELDFLEERLRRDSEVPTLHFRIKYLDFTMRPWYYSPYDVVFPQFQTQSQKIPQANQMPKQFLDQQQQQQQQQQQNQQHHHSNRTNSILVPGLMFDCHICPFTLQPYRFASELKRSLIRRREDFERMKHNDENDFSSMLRPPGKEFYRDEKQGLTVYELDGGDAEHAVYCRNLLLLARCFLENKLVGHDAGLYSFYVLAIDYDQIYPCSSSFSNNKNKNNSRFFTGYFSVEKGDPSHNLACVVILPCFQSRGLGRFLISMSYEVPKQKYRQELEKQLKAAEEVASSTNTSSRRRGGGGGGSSSAFSVHKTRKELEKSLSAILLEQIGTPERPFSDLGEKMYFRYWEQVVWLWASKMATEIVNAKAITIDDDTSSSDDDDDDDSDDSDSSSILIMSGSSSKMEVRKKQEDEETAAAGRGATTKMVKQEFDQSMNTSAISKGGTKSKDAKGKGKGQGKGTLNRRNDYDTNNNNNDETNHPNEANQTITKTISQIAKEIGITADDARETLLRVGLVHTTEKKTLKLLIPPQFARTMTDKVMKIPNLIKKENFVF